VILWRFTDSRSGAAVGALLFSSQYVFGSIYWSFGTIFEVVGTTLYFTGLLVWSVQRRSMPQVILASVIFLFALKAKETAITLPIIWLAYDLLVRRNAGWKMLSHLAVPGVVGAWYGFRKMAEMHATYREHPYYMDVTALTLGRGFGGYFNQLFTTNWRWQIWAIGFTVILLVFLVLKNRLAAFFQIYVFVTFLPVIFLINHRDAFYWYFPLLGVCGLTALLVRTVTSVCLRVTPQRLVAPLASVVFVSLCYGAYVRTDVLTAPSRSWQLDVSNEYRAFVSGATVPSESNAW
jgi:hypothetical protein